MVAVCRERMADKSRASVRRSR